MAKVNFHGETIEAQPLYETTSGWVMRSLQHAARLVPGTEFMVMSNEIISMDDQTAAIAKLQTMTIAEIEAAMAKERETLPPVAETLKTINDAAKAQRQAEAAAAAGERESPF